MPFLTAAGSRVPSDLMGTLTWSYQVMLVLFCLGLADFASIGHNYLKRNPKWAPKTVPVPSTDGLAVVEGLRGA